MSIVHHLKTQPVYFDAVERGDKPFEIRLDDRGFQRGDVVRLLRLPEKGEMLVSSRNDPTGGMRTCDRRITWILTDGFPGLAHGYVALGLAPVDAETPR